MQIRIEPPGTLIFDDGESTHQVAKESIDLYFRLKKENRITRKMSEETCGAFAFIDEYGWQQIYVPLTITHAAMAAIKAEDKQAANNGKEK